MYVPISFVIISYIICTYFGLMVQVPSPSMSSGYLSVSHLNLTTGVSIPV